MFNYIKIKSKSTRTSCFENRSNPLIAALLIKKTGIYLGYVQIFRFIGRLPEKRISTGQNIFGSNFDPASFSHVSCRKNELIVYSL